MSQFRKADVHASILRSGMRMTAERTNPTFVFRRGMGTKALLSQTALHYTFCSAAVLRASCSEIRCRNGALTSGGRRLLRALSDQAYRRSILYGWADRGRLLQARIVFPISRKPTFTDKFRNSATERPRCGVASTGGRNTLIFRKRWSVEHEVSSSHLLFGHAAG